jgi:pimeloyl-ACP methyl ester carboxylesterase
MQKGVVEINSYVIDYIEYLSNEKNAPTIVFLHEGLGCVALWKDFPERVAKATGCRVVVYSRYGYGQSSVLRESFNTDYMHNEALEALPEFLRQLNIVNPILFGHSDGGSIALIHAGAAQWPVRALILEAPHCFVEDLSIAGIEAAKQAYLTTDLGKKLGRYHADPDKTFWGWNDIWLHTDFRGWNIEEYLPTIACPVLAIQGVDDEYGTMAQIDAIQVQAGGAVDLLKLEKCAHTPHRDQADAVLAATVDFVQRIPG